jgi:2-polyprenyl-6-methoxyphenol hydroxylase-like FAD-dependent oxidoreductase
VNDSWDIVIVGAGPAGASAATLLARQGHRIALCEGKPFPREKVCGEFLGVRARPILARLGILDLFDAAAGPPITRVQAHAAHRTLSSPIPHAPDGAAARAISRGTLDASLLAAAHAAGAHILQPCHVTTISGNLQQGFLTATDRGPLHSRLVLLAHGLAQRGDMAPETVPRDRPTPVPHSPGPYLCFKAHFTRCDLDPHTIAIGGARGVYVGLVTSSAARCSLAFVVHRDRLARCGNGADAQLAALLDENAGFRRLLQNATRAGPWLASGPLAPGIRQVYRDGRFFLGNAAGEVHALVGEGITLALQAGGLLADAIARHGLSEAAGRAYERRWRRAFTSRYRAAQLFANLIMRPGPAACAAVLLRACPPALCACVRWAGK